MDVYSIGEMLIDFTPGAEPGSYIRKAGGAPTNVAIAAAKSGLSVGMCCSVGADDFGQFLMDTLNEYGVTPIYTELCTKAVTTLAIVTLYENGDRSFTFVRKPGADMFLPESAVKPEDIACASIIHAGSFSLSSEPSATATQKAMRLACGLGKLVSFDVNYRGMLWNDSEEACAAEVRCILPYVDLLKISEEEVDMFGGKEAIPNLMEEYHISVVVETLGSHGADCHFGGQIIHIPGRKVDSIDASAAGDAFWGAFIASLRLQGVERTSQLTVEIVEHAAKYGNASGSLCVQKKGAIEAIPTRREIEAILAG